MTNNIVPSLCCIHNGLKDLGFKFNTMTYAQYNKYGKKTAMKLLADRVLNNICTIHTTAKECIKNNWNYRIGGNVFPLMTHPKVMYKIEDFYNADEIYSEFKRCADTIKKSKARCSMHPDQFVVPSSPKDNVRESAIRDLENHGMIMDLLQLPQSHQSPINIHMNCFNNGNFTDAADRFISSYNLMTDSVKTRLVLECEDKGKSWNTQLLYDYVYKRIKMPITYDSHHHRCGNTHGNLTAEQACDLARTTWGKVKPLFHFSNGKISTTDRAHSDYVYELHTELFKHPTDVDFEFKQKEKSITKFILDFSNI
jgi:UV DNA damage endonuclease